MKKWLCLLIVFCMALALAACRGEEDTMVREAIEEILDAWEDVYEDNELDSDYVEIKNTRIITLEEDAAEEWEGFEDIRYIVEFELYTDYFDNAPYYVDVDYYCCVTVNAKGRMEAVKFNPLDIYRQTTYIMDLSDIIADVNDLGGAYNKVYTEDK